MSHAPSLSPDESLSHAASLSSGETRLIRRSSAPLLWGLGVLALLGVGLATTFLLFPSATPQHSSPPSTPSAKSPSQRAAALPSSRTPQTATKTKSHQQRILPSSRRPLPAPPASPARGRPFLSAPQRRRLSPRLSRRRKAPLPTRRMVRPKKKSPTPKQNNKCPPPRRGWRQVYLRVRPVGVAFRLRFLRGKGKHKRASGGFCLQLKKKAQLKISAPGYQPCFFSLSTQQKKLQLSLKKDQLDDIEVGNDYCLPRK